MLTQPQANQEAHIWDSGEGRLVTTIPPHQRAVSDIGWSPSEPNVLVTASLDSYLAYFYHSICFKFCHNFDDEFDISTCGTSGTQTGLCL